MWRAVLVIIAFTLTSTQSAIATTQSKPGSPLIHSFRAVAPQTHDAQIDSSTNTGNVVSVTRSDATNTADVADIDTDEETTGLLSISDTHDNIPTSSTHANLYDTTTIMRVDAASESETTRRKLIATRGGKRSLHCSPFRKLCVRVRPDVPGEDELENNNIGRAEFGSLLQITYGEFGNVFRQGRVTGTSRLLLNLNDVQVTMTETPVRESWSPITGAKDRYLGRWHGMNITWPEMSGAGRTMTIQISIFDTMVATRLHFGHKNQAEFSVMFKPAIKGRVTNIEDPATQMTVYADPGFEEGLYTGNGNTEVRINNHRNVQILPLAFQVIKTMLKDQEEEEKDDENDEDEEDEEDDDEIFVDKRCKTESPDNHEACNGRRVAVWFSEMCTYDTRGASIFAADEHTRKFVDGVTAKFTDLFAYEPTHEVKSPWFVWQVAPSMLALANRFDHAGLLCETPEHEQQSHFKSGSVTKFQKQAQDGGVATRNQEPVDYSWVKPGRVIRIYGIRTDSSDVIEANTERMAKVCSEFHACEYLLYDAGWYGDEFDHTKDPLKPLDSINIRKLVSIAKVYNLRTMFYVNRRGMKNLDGVRQLAQFLSSNGVSGVKLGFVKVTSNDGMRYVVNTIRIFAEFKMVINIHDNFRDYHISRTFPNVLSVEGVRGDEHWNEDATERTLMLPFVRAPGGRMDNTFVTSAKYREFFRVTELAQAAKAIILPNGLLTLYWYDSSKEVQQINNDKTSPFTLWQGISAGYADSKYLDAKPGEYVSVARKDAVTGVWHVAALTRVTHTFEWQLGRFLDCELMYELESWSDPIGKHMKGFFLKRDRVADVDGRGLVSCFDRLSCDFVVGTKDTAQYPGCIRRLTPVEYVGGGAIEEGHFVNKGGVSVENRRDDGHDEVGSEVHTDIHDADDGDESTGSIKSHAGLQDVASVKHVREMGGYAKGKNKVVTPVEMKPLPTERQGNKPDTLGLGMWLVCVCVVSLLLSNIRGHYFGRRTLGNCLTGPRRMSYNPAPVRSTRGGAGAVYTSNGTLLETTYGAAAVRSPPLARNTSVKAM